MTVGLHQHVLASSNAYTCWHRPTDTPLSPGSDAINYFATTFRSPGSDTITIPTIPNENVYQLTPSTDKSWHYQLFTVPNVHLELSISLSIPVQTAVLHPDSRNIFEFVVDLDLSLIKRILSLLLYK